MFELILEALLRLLAEIFSQVIMEVGLDAIVNHFKGEKESLKEWKDSLNDWEELLNGEEESLFDDEKPLIGDEKPLTGFKIKIFGIIFFASIVGFVSLWIFPYHLFKPLLFPGINLILSPLIVGLIMHRIGQWKEENKKKSTVLTTFWGGASFAFIVALIRFIFFNVAT